MKLAISNWDLAIVLVYMAFAIALGVWVGRHQRDMADYFLGGRNLPWWALLLSIVATETSTVTFLSIPGVSFAADGGDFRFLQLTLGYIVGRVLVAWVLLPLYFEGRLFTSYQVLHQRFGAATSKLASLLFMITRTVADALRLFLTAIVLHAVLQLDMTACVVLVGIATIVYTFLGGMRSVVWNDCIQFVVYMLGAAIALWILVGRIPGNWPALVEFGRANDKWVIWDFDTDVTASGITFWIGLLGGMFLTFATHGTDQLTVQRLLSTNNRRAARLALIGSGIIVTAQFALFLLIGVALACFHQTQQPPPEFTAKDEVFATFIVNELPVGVVGITLAAVFSAAMSTLSSSLNASASALVNDFIKPRMGAADADGKLVFVGRLATVLFGVLQMGIAIGSQSWLENRSTVDQVLKIAGFTSGPILGLFFLAVWPRRIPQSAALAGFVGGLIVLNLFVFQTSTDGAFPWLEFRQGGVNGYYYSLIGSVSTFMVGLGFALIFRRSR